MSLAKLGPGYSACGLDQQGVAWCWGAQVAPNGSLVGAAVPQLVGGGHSWSQVSAAAGVGCGVAAASGGSADATAAAGALLCWGDNSRGVLGEGAGAFSVDPVPRAPGVGPWAMVAVGENSGCGITQGRLYCFVSSRWLYCLLLPLASLPPPLTWDPCIAWSMELCLQHILPLKHFTDMCHAWPLPPSPLGGCPTPSGWLPAGPERPRPAGRRRRARHRR